ncbi:multidrug and toxin extrusion protein [Purpureocillium lavendulum]|uniref:Multidrug and toxin extrusion protein n=1 Tax=Purpureocillium lavendulum TaxID=1247861 RepID=A0AB34G0F5_9HYPO|nr:multidrug and toxin extrusion protein [Purpureocillium lavendulum]
MPSGVVDDVRAPTLPSPAEIRALNQLLDKTHGANYRRPPPVRIPPQGLFVKYGADVTVIEAITQTWVRDQLRGIVTVPEVFGWTQDGGQTFIYMSLIEGAPLHHVWGRLSDGDRRDVCGEVRQAVTAWRSLEQGRHDHYVGTRRPTSTSRQPLTWIPIGKLNRQPLNDTILSYRSKLTGPFQGAEAVQQLQEACDIHIGADEQTVFTHNSLVASNILLSPGPHPHLAAIVGWGQAGWYPAYWEYCKARYMSAHPRRLGRQAQDEWQTQYLPSVIDPVDDEVYWRPWLSFALSNA